MTHSDCIGQVGTMLERNENELNAFEELGAGERDDAEVEEHAEENGKRNDAQKVLAQETQPNGHVHKQVGQALLFHLGQLGLVAGDRRGRVDGETLPVRQRAYRIRAHPFCESNIC